VTEVITTADGSLSVLLGSGASTAVSIMIDLVGRCFKDKLATTEWQAKIKEMIPSYGMQLNDNPVLSDEIRKIQQQF
jgi:malate dehydrogenase (quinone)